jgi:hypothetical protein
VSAAGGRGTGRWLAPAILAFWAGMGTLATAQRLVLSAVDPDARLSAARAAALGFGFATLMAATIVAALAVASAFPLVPGRMRRNLALGAACGMAAAVVLSVAEAWFRGALGDNVLPGMVPASVLLPGRATIFFNLVAMGHAVAFARTLRARERSAARLEAEVARSQLELTRAKVQPRLLHGTLGAVAELVRSDAHAAERALTRMSDYLRGTLYRGRAGWAAAREQAALLGAYLEMVRPARGAPAPVELDPAAADLPVPHFLLESLADVVAPPGTGAHVTLAQVGGDSGGARIRVGGTLPAASAGAALDGVRQRLAALYGGGATAELRPLPGGGSEVRVRLPAAAPADAGAEARAHA